MKSIISSRGGRLLTTLLLGGVALFGATLASAKNPPTASSKKSQASAPTVIATAYSGRAIGLNIQGVEEPVVGSIILADTGALPTAGGSLEANESNYTLLGADGVTVALGVEFAHATTVGTGAETTVDSSLTGFQVFFANHAGDLIAITADYIAASASASIAPNGTASAMGTVSVSNLRINGEPVVVTGEPNQTVAIPDGRIVFNEQLVVTTNGQADITLVAMHVYICDCMNGAFGSVYAGITAGNTPPPADHDCGKLTGGGWIVSPSGAKATFGVSGGIRRGEFWGHLNYIDHGTGLKVKSTRVTNYTTSPSDHDCRIISYDVVINGLAGTAVVEACDHDEPGRNDTFSIRLSTGYSAQGSLGGDRPGGGNIQLHKCPPGWAK